MKITAENVRINLKCSIVLKIWFAPDLTCIKLVHILQVVSVIGRLELVEVLCEVGTVTVACLGLPLGSLI